MGVDVDGDGARGDRAGHTGVPHRISNVTLHHCLLCMMKTDESNLDLFIYGVGTSLSINTVYWLSTMCERRKPCANIFCCC